MTEITTVAELEALTVGTPVRDRDGDVWRKGPDGSWCFGGNSFGGILPDFLLSDMGPIAAEGASSPEFRVTRCSGSDSCTNTAPLPIGSHYLCPDCAGTHHITTRGNR
jgi:hypothetical protein